MNSTQPKALFISASDFHNDSRLLRLHKRVNDKGFHTSLAAYSSLEQETAGTFSPVPQRYLTARLMDVAKMCVSRILPDNQLLHLLSNRLITKDLAENATLLSRDQAINLVIVKHWTSLPIALLLDGAPIIWLDINEVFEAEHDSSKLWQLIYKPVIQRLLKIADSQIILRSATSLEQIKHMHDERVLHLPNTKEPFKDFESRKTFNPIKLLYHGLITTNRALETIIKAMKQSGREDLVLTIRGQGKPKTISRLKSLVTEFGLEDKVQFEPSVENSKLIEEASKHDIGICLFANHSKQLILAEPNKIYEYMAAGLGIIASDTPTMQQLIKDKNIGELSSISNQQTEDVTKILKALTPDKIRQWRENAHISALETWERNYDWPKLDLFLKQIQQRHS